MNHLNFGFNIKSEFYWEDEWQYRFHGSADIRYNFNNYFGVYIEYYGIKSHSDMTPIEQFVHGGLTLMASRPTSPG